MAAIASHAAAQDRADNVESALRAAAERVAPSVVKIETIGGLERVGKVLVTTGPTTGLIVDEAGYIVSSAFNFIQQPSSILVTLPGGKRTAAQIVARDKSRMLVLLKVNTSDKLPVPAAVPRSEMTVGQWAIAVGRTYDQPQPNVSVGVLSATNRIWSTAIQTDAKISPANYGGPLIDIQGRVLGVLVPLSPQKQSPQKQGGEVAGAEWYDSGIGFAVPLGDIFAALPRLKEGHDQYPGLLGISLQAGDMYSLPAELAAAQPGSPAYKAGLKKGDTIVELDGQPISRIAQLKHALGPRYAGDKVHVVFTRGKEKERKSVEIELVDKLIPYQHPFLGILPMRDGEGVHVRYVYPKSPAEAAGLKRGDRITLLGEAKVSTADDLRTLVANLEPKAKVTLKFERDGETKSVELTPASLPTDIPGELPAATSAPLPEPAEKPTTGIVEIKLPEEKNECVAYVPANYHPQLAHGLLVMLPAPGPVDRDKLAERWKMVAEERQLIVLVPMSATSDKWEPTETEFIRKTLDDCLTRFNIDRSRLAVYGHQTGGTLAWLFGCENIDRVRAIVAVNATPPQRLAIPDNDPINRLAFFIATAEKSPAGKIAKQLAEHLSEEKFPVTEFTIDKPRDLSPEELSDLGRWLDALDRI
jgi:serine protease Do